MAFQIMNIRITARMTKLMVSCRFIHQVRFGIMVAHALLFVRLYRRRSLVGDPLAVITRGYPLEAGCARRRSFAFNEFTFPQIVCLCHRLRISNIDSANFHHRLYTAR